MSDELDPRWLEEDDNSNTSWDTFDVNEIASAEFVGHICQIRGTTTGGLPGKLNGYYGIIVDYTYTRNGGYFVVDMPQVSHDVVFSPKFVLVQTTGSQKGALMLPNQRFLRP